MRRARNWSLVDHLFNSPHMHLCESKCRTEEKASMVQDGGARFGGN
jgi:hypothetical protein